MRPRYQSGNGAMLAFLAQHVLGEEWKRPESVA